MQSNLGVLLLNFQKTTLQPQQVNREANIILLFIVRGTEYNNRKVMN